MAEYARRPIRDGGSGGVPAAGRSPHMKLVGANITVRGVHGTLQHIGKDQPRHYATSCGRIVLRYDHESDSDRTMMVTLNGRIVRDYALVLRGAEPASKSKGRFKRFGSM